jgi:superfamily II DNA or RNA helicase
MRLVVGNSYSQLVGVDGRHLAALRKILFYEADPSQAYFSGGHHNTKRFLIDVKGSFATGLLYLVVEYLNQYAPETAIQDTRVRPKPTLDLKLNLAHVPYPEQLEAARIACISERGIICAPTGTGKSVIIALLIDTLQVPTLVVVPSLELKRQLSESLRQCFGPTPHIRVENVDALDPKTPITGFGCVILDEFHHSAAKTYRELNKKAWAGIYHRFGLTATPFRTQDHERLLLESILAEVVYRIEYTTAVKKGYIVPIEAFYLDIPKTKVEGFTWNEVYKELVTDHASRNTKIRELLLNLDAAGISALCLIKEIAHGDKICAGTDLKFANGLNDDTKRLIDDFNSRKINVLVGTTGILGEGVDSKPAEFVIIAGLGKAKGQFMQCVGRAVRRYPGKESAKVILLRDSSHKWALAHFNAQLKVLKDEYGVKPVKLC